MTSDIADKPLQPQLTEATDQIKAGNLASAISTLKAILNHHPGHEISLGMLASIYLQIGMHEQAIEHFDALLTTSPGNPLARFQMGMAKLSQGQPEAALDTWEPMLTLENEFMAHFHSALALMQLGRNQEALERLIHSSRHMPSSHPLYPQLLDLHTQLTEKTRR